MRFGILGPLEVADEGGRGLGLGGHKQRSVLAILLLHPNEAVSSDQLTDDLWSGRPPASAATSLQAHVSRLRRALGEDGRIVTTAGGYLLRVAPGELDVDRFERLVEEGASALSSGDGELAARRLRDALELWRGPPLSDFRYESFAQSEITRLEETRLAALEDRIDADLALGRHGSLTGELQALILEHPLRERLRGQLMIALYRAGRQSDALEVYRETSDVMREELGLEPSHGLQDLELAILQHDLALQPPHPEQPRGQPGSLPAPSTPFLGRVEELAEVSAMLRSPGKRLVTLTGAGGSGKTRLALRTAEACAGHYRDGAWFVGFADIVDPELIVPTICQALGVAEQPGVPPVELLRERLGERELLLVLDNLEQLASGTVVLGELLAACPGFSVLATSREALHLAGEQRYEVPVLGCDDAIALFTARARGVAPGLSIERDSVGAVCERLDRLPLAIELAAARAKVLSPAELLARLERRLPVLARGPRDAPQRQGTLQATIDWSYELLTEEEQRLFARLSVFSGGCTFQAAEAVCDAELDTLGSLVDRSLLRADEGRCWMLQTLREYALDRLAQSGEEDHVRSRHAEWFVELLEAQGIDESTEVDVRKTRVLLEEERENFRAALEWAHQAGEIETVARLAAPLTRLWSHEGSLTEADRWLGVARERSSEYPLALQALVLSAARELASAREAHQEWADLCDQALAAYRELGNVAGVIREMSMRAVAATELGDLPRARAMMEEAVQLAREHDLTGWLASLADIAIAEGRLHLARSLCEEALSTGPAASSDTAVSARLNLAYIANLERRHADAAGLAREALTGALARRFLNAAAAGALYLAWSLAELRQPERASRLLGAALEFHRDTGTGMQWSETACEQAVRDALDAQLDERTFHALLDEGRSTTLEQAVRKECRQSQQCA